MIVAGLDEVGRGPIAGPLLVVAAAFSVDYWPVPCCEKHPAGMPVTCSDPKCPIAPPPCPVPKVKDSKAYSDGKQRSVVATALLECPKFLGLGRGIVTSTDLSDRGMTWAINSAFERAVSSLPVIPDLILVDGEMGVPSWPGQQLWGSKGDNKWWPVAAASVLAKVERDGWMLKLSEIYPGYGWERNKGYGTKEHFEAIRALGTSPVHRLSFLNRQVAPNKL